MPVDLDIASNYNESMISNFSEDFSKPLQLSTYINSGTEGVKEEAFIAYKSNLRDLALSVPPKHCDVCGKSIKDVKMENRGTALHIDWVKLYFPFLLSLYLDIYTIALYHFRKKSTSTAHGAPMSCCCRCISCANSDPKSLLMQREICNLHQQSYS